MNKKTKSILAGLALGCVGALAMTGCSMNDEQIKDINDKVDTAITTFDSYVDNQDKYLQSVIDSLQEQNDYLKTQISTLEAQLTKEEAWDIFVGARVNMDLLNMQKVNSKYSFSDYSVHNNVVSNTKQEGIQIYTDSGCFYAGWSTENGEENLYNAVKIDNNNFDNSYHYYPEGIISKVNVLNQYNIGNSMGLGAFSENNLVSYSYQGGIYTFSFCLTNTKIEDTNVEHFTGYYTLIIKDNYVVSMKGCQSNINTTVSAIEKDGEDYVDDGFGGYVIHSNNIVSYSEQEGTVVCGEELEESDIERVKAVISNIDAKIESGELVLPNE